MNIKKNITLNFTESELKQIIAEHITNNTEYSVKAEDVEFNIGRECRGYGTAEHEEVVFKGCTVKYKG